MAEYSRAELENMQREAERRVAEMQQRARKNLNWENFGSATEKNGRNNPYSSSKNQNTPGFSPRQETSRPPFHGPGHSADFNESSNPEPPNICRNPPEHRDDSHPSGMLSRLLSGPMSFLDKLNFGDLLKDSDTALIAAVLLLISRDDNDPLLRLALIYIML